MEELLVQTGRDLAYYCVRQTKGNYYAPSSKISIEVCHPKCLKRYLLNHPIEDDEVMDLPVERDLLDKLKTRVEIAREIDKIQHGTTKENHDKNWLKITAEALEIDLSDEE